ncbi:hypothetical protein OG836_06795 [Micromonospora zamorensis]|uniref:hypothetical protein n=1 Tax=Micromonospora zamorensis TaxID=709883 RepID=UPI002E21466D|nr:hypothetical protein OG423_02395 [Micromonospora zamorensis]
MPSPRKVSYSSVPATTVPITPPKNADVTNTDAGTCHRPVRACANVRNVSGTSVAPSRINAGTKFGFLVLTRVRSQ